MAITEQLCGFQVSSTQVSRAAQGLDAELEAWRQRPLGEIRYLFLDARYEKVWIDGTVRDAAVYIALGLRPDGRKQILGVSVALSEAEIHWREFLASLNQRGLRGVRLVISDDHAGLKAARRAELSGVPWQRCQFHLQQNVIAVIPHVALRKEVARLLRSIFQAPDREEADRRLKAAVGHWGPKHPRLAEWIETHVTEGLTVLAFPESHRRVLRTANLLETTSKEVKRRTQVATLFPNEASLLRLVSAVLIEISDDWETGRIHLTMTED